MRRRSASDVSLSLTYRPFTSQNVVLRLAGSTLVPQQGYKDLFGSDDCHTRSSPIWCWLTDGTYGDETLPRLPACRRWPGRSAAEGEHARRSTTPTTRRRRRGSRRPMLTAKVPAASAVIPTAMRDDARQPAQSYSAAPTATAASPMVFAPDGAPSDAALRRRPRRRARAATYPGSLALPCRARIRNASTRC